MSDVSRIMPLAATARRRLLAMEAQLRSSTGVSTAVGVIEKNKKKCWGILYIALPPGIRTFSETKNIISEKVVKPSNRRVSESRRHLLGIDQEDPDRDSSNVENFLRYLKELGIKKAPEDVERIVISG